MLWSNHFEICKWFFKSSVQHFTILVYMFMVGAYGMVNKPSWMWEILGKPKYGVWVELILISGNTSVACCCWPKCYHILNWFFLPKPGFLEFIWIFSRKKHLKINISHILNPNLTKEIPLNPAHQDLSKITKGTFQFLRNFQLRFNSTAHSNSS